MTGAPLLELQNVSTSLRIDGRLALVVSDVSFSVRRGEIVGLVGESGSGKSITARTIMRLLPRGAACSGSVVLDGREVPLRGRSLARVRRRAMSMIFQDPRAHIDPLYRNGSHLTEGLAAHRNLRGEPATAEALRLLASVGIADAERVFRAYPGEISGGMLQRVLIAGALTGDPMLLIADEPTTALLDRVRSQGRGILFITHDLDLAAAICDRMMVMYAGRIVEQQPTAQLFERPLHPYTARLISARPRLDHRQAPIPTIPGRAVSAFDAPAGCPFHPRCAHVTEECTSLVPPLVPVSEVASSACRRVAEIKELLRLEVANG
jgi:oligopeptide transport system ATP-binding protein